MYRRGFTLLEILLVLAVLAAVTAVAVPQVGLLLGDRTLVRSGDQVQIEMTRLRVDAMRQGRIMMMQGMVEGNSIRIKPFYSLSDATEAMDQTGSQMGMRTGADQGIVIAAPIQDPSAEDSIDFPEGVMIRSVATVSAARAYEIEQLTAADQAAGWSRPILFYPDGTTSTAAVTLSHESLGRVVVKLRGITGDASVSEVLQ